MSSKSAKMARIDLSTRLFFRFLICYLLAFAIGWLLAVNRVSISFGERIALYAALPVPLALLGGFSKICNPYLLLLTTAKALWEAQLFYHVTLLLRTHTIGLLPANAYLVTLFFSLLLYTAAAVVACRFAFETYQRDLRLLFSRDTFRYLLVSICLLIPALLLYLLWPHLSGLLPC